MMMGIVDAEPKMPAPVKGVAQATPSVATFEELIVESVVARVLA